MLPSTSKTTIGSGADSITARVRCSLCFMRRVVRARSKAAAVNAATMSSVRASVSSKAFGCLDISCTTPNTSPLLVSGVEIAAPNLPWRAVPW